MDDAARQLFEQLGVSLALGLLIGLQREYAASPLAGLRTFALVALLGTLATLIDTALFSGGWVVAAIAIALAGVVAVGTLAQSRREPHETGITTEAALLLTFALGAYIPHGDRVLAVVAGGATAVLLHFKPELHGLVKRLGTEDLRAIMIFVLLTCVVLPLVPDENYGPFKALNPFHIWLMAVLIVGISLAGYIAYKFFGQSAGILLGGILGGAISSTATTASYARRAHAAPATIPAATAIILIASTVVFVRVLTEIAVVAPASFAQLAPPIAIVLFASAIASLILWLRIRKQANEMPQQQNPAELRAALLFALLYAGVLLALAAAKHYVGGSGLYLVASLSGLTDMDAITISTARLVEQGEAASGLTPTTGWHLILLASVSNLLFKVGIAGALGGARLCARLLMIFSVPLLAALAVIALWR